LRLTSLGSLVSNYFCEVAAISHGWREREHILGSLK
jgi:hypothetical protein